MTNTCASALGFFLIGLLFTSENCNAAEIEYSLTFASNYLFNGVSQSAEGPALQGEFIYTSDTGFYGAIWLSSVDFRPQYNAEFEVNYRLGFRESLTPDLTLDLGAERVDYIGNDVLELDATELFSEFTIKENTSATFSYAQATNFFRESLSFQLKHEKTIAQNTKIKLRSLFLSEQGDKNLNLVFRVGLLRTLGNFDIELSWQDTRLRPALRPISANTQNFVLEISFGEHKRI